MAYGLQNSLLNSINHTLFYAIKYISFWAGARKLRHSKRGPRQESLEHLH